MTHLDDGTLQALIDGELLGVRAVDPRDHLEGCGRCRERSETLRGNARFVTGALREVDVAPPVEEARWAVRRWSERTSVATGASPAGARSRSPRSSGTPWLRVAAMLLVVVGVGAAGLPGSPVRAWLERTFDAGPSEETSLPATTVPEAEVLAPAADEEVGVRLAPADGRVRVLLRELDAGTRVSVRLVDGAQAAVYGGEGTLFRTGPGRVEATVAGPSVRIELPRGVVDAVVEAGGRPWLRKVGERLEVLGPVRDSTGTEIRFEVPGREER